MEESIVREYFTTFFGAEPDLHALRELLTDDFCFKGPLLESTSADEYIGQLKGLGIGGLKAHNLIFATHDDRVAVLYELVMPFGTISTTEWFWIRGGKISRIELLNDPRPLIR